MTKPQQEDEMDKDPNNWKWGIFYYNPDDDRLFVPKRIPSFGATINFGNPKAYLVFFSIIFMILVAAAFSVFDNK
jgi:uncharacterized membrane protein